MLVAPWSDPNGYAVVPFVLLGQLVAAGLCVVVVAVPGAHRRLLTLWGLLTYVAAVGAGLALKQNWLDSTVSILAVGVLVIALAHACLFGQPRRREAQRDDGEPLPR
jgi:hypothetical protein